MVAGIEPCKASAQRLHHQRPSAQIFVVDRSDFDLTSCRRLYVAGNFHNVVIIKIQSGNCVVALGMLRFFLDGKRFAVFIEFHHAIFSGIADKIAENRRTLFPLRCLTQHSGKALSIENIVAQNEGNAVVSDEIRADQKCVCQSAGRLLNRIGHRKSQLLACTEQFFKSRQIPGRGNNQNLPDARQHQCGEWIINHRFVVNRHNLFGYRLGQRIKAGSGAACKNDTFHRFLHSYAFIRLYEKHFALQDRSGGTVLLPGSTVLLPGSTVLLPCAPAQMRQKGNGVARRPHSGIQSPVFLGLSGIFLPAVRKFLRLCTFRYNISGSRRWLRAPSSLHARSTMQWSF